MSKVFPFSTEQEAPCQGDILSADPDHVSLETLIKSLCFRYNYSMTDGFTAIIWCRVRPLGVLPHDAQHDAHFNQCNCWRRVSRSRLHRYFYLDEVRFPFLIIAVSYHFLSFLRIIRMIRPTTEMCSGKRLQGGAGGWEGYAANTLPNGQRELLGRSRRLSVVRSKSPSIFTVQTIAAALGVSSGLPARVKKRGSPWIAEESFQKAACASCISTSMAVWCDFSNKPSQS